MAESAYRPLSRGHHNVKIPVDSPTNFQSVHSMDTTIHTEYSEVNVYETSVRPKSRLKEGHNRPKSAYNNRFRREASRSEATTPRAGATTPSATTPRDYPEERPLTSRGRRDSSGTRQSVDVTAGESALVSRPKSGYGRRQDVNTSHDIIDIHDRPQSRRARRISHDPDPRTPLPAGSMLQRERTMYDMTTSQRQTETGDNGSRPRDGRSSQMSDNGGSMPSTPRNTSNPSERPKTGHGRRRQHSQSEDNSAPEPSPRTSIERPKSRAGRRGYTGPDSSDYTYSGGGTNNNADILVVEEERPRTGRARRRNIPIDLSYMNPARDRDRDQVGTTPSPSPRPPTGRRPKSSRRQKVSKPPNSPAYDYERQMTTTPVSLSRPASSTLNRFTPLPAIGGRNDAANSSSYHIHIPHAGEPGAAPGAGTAHNIYNNNAAPHRSDGQQPSDYPNNNLTEYAQRLNLQDSELQASATEPSLYPPLQRPADLPPEPPVDSPDKLILAIKLPDGTRVQRAFRPQDQLDDVLHFAEVSAQLDFGRCELVCDVPRQVYKDLGLTLAESGLQNRTVLHVQLPDGL